MTDTHEHQSSIVTHRVEWKRNMLHQMVIDLSPSSDKTCYVVPNWTHAIVKSSKREIVANDGSEWGNREGD